MADSKDNSEENKGGDIFKRLNIKRREEGKPKPAKRDFKPKAKPTDAKPISTKPKLEKGKVLPEGKFHLVATCMQNLEDELEQELIDLGAEQIEKQKRAIRFVANLELLYKANIWLRTAIKVLKPMYHFKAENTDELYSGAMDIAWETVFSKDKTFSIDFSVHSENFTHSQFAALRLKDAIVDRFRKQGIDRPSVAREQPDVRIHLHINGNQVNLSLDSSGEPLFKRGYRRERHFAPINECLAAGLILKTGWKGEVDFLDPMTGSGTIAIEAAMIACNIPANFSRTFFAFENWEDYDQALLSKVLREAQGQFKPLTCKIYAREIASNNIRATRVNVNTANMRKSIILEQEDFFKAAKPSDKGIIVMNPPYGERLELKEGLPDFFSKIGSTLKHEYPGWSAWIISSDIESFHNIALKPSQKIPMMNGKLECQFRAYELFDGTLKENKAS